MPKVSKFLKVDKNVLLEYVYDSENNLSEQYGILVNTRDRKQSYIAGSASGTNNTQSNSLFKLDNLSNRFGKIDTGYYSFLQVRNYSTTTPTRHDTLRVHLPVNWTFGEYLGFYVRIYGYDTLNQQTYDLSNFYFDMTDSGQSYLLNFTSPPLLFQEKLWGKNIQIELPSLSAISSQKVNNRPKENSVNANLTNGSGFSITVPIFIDFHFINNVQTVNGVSTYILGSKVSVSLPQTPEYETLGLMIENSPNGDFFEIYGTYNGTLAGFDQFIEDSYYQGHRYYVQYSITMYEQNIRGKTTTAIVTENFNETIEFRPIIKFSTTTAIIDVEMRLIDAVDDTYIIRRASYGMLQDEVARYSLNLIKINLKYANKPKIYNIKGSVDPSLVGVSNAMGQLKLTGGRNVVMPSMSSTGAIGENGVDKATLSNSLSNNLETVYLNSSFEQEVGGGGLGIRTEKVPYPVLFEKVNIMSKSDSAMLNGETYYADGLISIMIKPFDNILKFSIATGSPTSPKVFNLSGFSEIRLIIKDDTSEASFGIWTQGGVSLENGQVVFNITEDKIASIKKIYNNGVNIFYIVGVSGGSKFVIYSGLFKIFDSPTSVAELNQTASKAGTPTAGNTNNSINSQMAASGVGQSINLDPTIGATTTTVNKPLSTGTAPTAKPTLNKDTQINIQNGKFK